jgi:hypothetical protein
VARRVGALVLVLVVLLGAGGGAVLAAGGSAPAPGAGAAPAAGIPAADLERAFRRVIARREFAWRLPPPPARADEENEGMVTRFLHSVTRTIRGWVDATGDFFSPIIRWILEHLDRMAPGTPEEGAAPGWPRRASWILLGVGIVVAGVLWRWWRGREAPVQAQAVAVTPTVVPDVATAGPGDAASDHWLAQARALLERGEARLAARAVHLGTLALLGEAGILTLGRARSDRDYLREMRRRRPDRPEMAALFGDGVQRFERVWYGEHPAGTELVEFLREQCERLRSHARG